MGIKRDKVSLKSQQTSTSLTGTSLCRPPPAVLGRPLRVSLLRDTAQRAQCASWGARGPPSPLFRRVAQLTFRALLSLWGSCPRGQAATLCPVPQGRKQTPREEQGLLDQSP